MGIVYEAWDNQRGELVALKTLRDLNAGAIYRLKQEFRAVADVAHPNLVGLHELLAEGERWFFTMDRVRGVDFLSWVRPGWSITPLSSDTTQREGALPSARAATKPDSSKASVPAQGPGTLDEQRLRSALAQLSDAIAALHDADRVHRDLKPSNVLVEADGRVVVLDFGLAIPPQEAKDDGSLEPGIAGTPAYMAPEQAAMEPTGPAADWYALGVMLYEALTGRAPYTGTQLQVLTDKQRRPPVPPQQVAPEAPPDLCALCEDLLRRFPEQRPAASEVRRRVGAPVLLKAPASLPAPLPLSSTGIAPFIGQEPILLALQQAFAEVMQGRAVTVWLRGSSGVGTSTVARHFAERIELEARAVVLTGRCHERESVPFKGLDSLIDAMSRYLRRLPRPEVEAVLPRDIRALSRMFPVLRRVEAVSGAPERAAETPDPQELRRRAVAGLRELLGRIADRRPLVLVIDGLQWADADTAALLPDLLRSPDAPAVLVIACYRASVEAALPEPALGALDAAKEEDRAPQRLSDLRARLTAACLLREVEVQPLTPPEAGQLASLLLSRAGLPLSHAASVADESRGNPFFVNELVRALQFDDRYRGTASGMTLAEAIRIRLGGLPESARAILEIVAVSAGPLSPVIAAQAAGLATQARATMSLLRAAHLLRTSADGERVEMYHDRIRATVVETMDAARVGRAHLKLVAALEMTSTSPDAATLAFHYRALGQQERAAEYAALAADRATEALAFERGARLYRMALALRAPDAEWGRQLEAREGDALAAAGQGPQAAESYLRAAARPWATRAEAMELRRRAAEQYLRAGHIDEGMDILRSVLRAHGMRIASTPRRALLSLVLRRAQIRIRGTRVEPRDVSQVSAEELARVDVCWAGAVGLGMVDIIRGSAFQAQHLLLALHAREPMRVARALAAEAPFVAMPGNVHSQRAAQRLVGQAHTLARRLEQPQIKALATFTAAIVDFLGGRWRSCHEQADQAAALFRDRCTGVAWELSNCHLFSLWSLFYLGELGELSRRVEALRSEAISRGDLYAATSFRTGLTNVALLVGDDIEGARREVGEARARWSQQDFHFQHYFCLLAEGITDLYAGEGQAAYQRMERSWPNLQRTLMLRVQNVMVEATHLRGRSALAAMDGSPADFRRLKAVARDARTLARVPLPWSAALAVLLEAGLRLALGDRPGAADLFQQAADRLASLDMSLFAAAARRRLGELRGASGNPLVAEANAAMLAQGIANPARMAMLLAPGI